MSKKFLIIIILALVVVGAGGYAYYALFMKQGTPLVPVDTTQTDADIFPVSGQSTSNQTANKPITPSNSIDGTPSIVQISSGGQNLIHLTTEPVSGFSIIPGLSTTSPTIRYTEQKSGHIFDINLSSYVQNRISNTTLPNIYEALFTAKGDQGIYRYLKENTETVESYFFKLSTSTLSSGYFLPEDVKTLAVSPSGAKIFYIVSDESGTKGIIDNRDTNKKSTIFSSEFSDWTVSWPNDSVVALYTRPTSGVSGYLYFLNPSTGTIKTVISGTNGLTALVNPGATSILLGDSTNSLFSYDVKTAASYNMGIYSRPEKCAWSKRDKNIAYCGGSPSVSYGNFPDNWYQGLFSFSDDLYKVNVSSGTTTRIIDIQSEFSQNLDVSSPMLSPDEKYFVFKNKSDGTLWSVKLP